MESNNQALSTDIVDQVDHDRHQLISSFLEIAVGQTVETARTFLQGTNWDIEKAINLFFLMTNNSSMHYNNQVSDSDSDETLSDHDDSSDFSSLYPPPSDLLFEGSFQDAKSVSAENNLWLIVNIQSRTEFASHTLNLDVWSNEEVREALDESKFLLWQVYDHSVEGQKVSSFYKIDSVPPVVLVIDPITGQKMHMWSGVIEAKNLVEGLIPFMDAGPSDHLASHTRKRYPDAKETYLSRNNRTDQVLAPSWGEEFEEEDNVSSATPPMGQDFERLNLTDQVVDPSRGEEFEETVTCSASNNTNDIAAPSLGPESEESIEVKEEGTCLEFPVLTEEPKEECDPSLVCNLCLRFPDGRRKQRRFLKTEPVQLLWSFCYSHMKASDRKLFKLVCAIPGASKTLDFGANETFDQSGLANSIISVNL